MICVNISRLIYNTTFLGPLHTLNDSVVSLPLLGDTTSNQALLFSPPIASGPSHETPSYPNYTLPAANSSYPVGPSSPLGVTLSIIPTTSSALSTLPRTGCALRNSTAEGLLNVGAKESEGLWLKDDDGWRWQWMVNGLTPQTNYTIFAITDTTHVSGPINFVTKSGEYFLITHNSRAAVTHYLCIQLLSLAQLCTLCRIVRLSTMLCLSNLPTMITKCTMPIPSQPMSLTRLCKS